MRALPEVCVRATLCQKREIAQGLVVGVPILHRTTEQGDRRLEHVLVLTFVPTSC